MKPIIQTLLLALAVILPRTALSNGLLESQRPEGVEDPVEAGKWYRLAETVGTTGSARANAVFTLTDQTPSGGHSSLTFRAGISFSNAPRMGVTVLSHTSFKHTTFTKIRILEGSTNTTPSYLEVFVNRGGGIVRCAIYDDFNQVGWRLPSAPSNAWDEQPVTPPAGYTSREYNVDKLFMVGGTSEILSVARDGTVDIAGDLRVDGEMVRNDLFLSKPINSGAGAFGAIALGQYNEDIFTSQNSWIGDGLNSIFEIGVGTSSQSRRNAVTVFQDGAIKLGIENTGNKAAMPLRTPLEISADGTLLTYGKKRNFYTASYEAGMVVVQPNGTETKGYPPGEHIRKHLYMPNKFTVIVDYPENISATLVDGQPLEHRAVIEAAIRMFYRASVFGSWPPDSAGRVDSYWQPGEIRLQAGNYELDRQIVWPGRMNLIGATGCVRNAGTRISAKLQGTWSPSDYLIRLNRPINNSGTAWNVNANFCQHLKDIFFDAKGLCRGVAWGGAQCSTIKNIQLISFSDIGVRILNGTNAMTVENVWVFNHDGDHSTPETGTAFVVDDYVQGLTFIGCKAERAKLGFELGADGDAYLIGCYCENLTTAIRRNGWKGSARCIGLSVKGLGAGVSDRVLFDFPNGMANFRASGFVRENGGGNSPIMFKRNNLLHVLSSSSSAIVGYDFDLLAQVRAEPRLLAGGQSLVVGRTSHDAFASDRTLTFSGNELEGSKAELVFDVTSSGGVTLTFPSSVILGGAPGATSSQVFPEGSHRLSWQRANETWYLEIN